MDNEVKAAHPAMLVLAREVRGMTQVGLAEAMSTLTDGASVSQGYISRAEAGRLVVSGDRLALYARALRFPAHALCVDAEVHGVGVGLIHHRKRASLGAQALRRIHAELAVSRLQVRALVSAVGGQHSHRFCRIDVDDLNPPIDAASTLRKDWAVPAGPIERMVEVIEGVGGLVISRDLGTRELDAVSQWATSEEAPLFLLNEDVPMDRFRWSLAHELGHVLMHPEPGPPSVQERQADEFASEFLMPASSIHAELRNGAIDLNRLLSLKQKWGVSMAALARRALSLGAITEWQYRNLMIEMSALGYRTQEPGDIAREPPTRIPALVTHLEHDLGYSVEQIADLAGVLPDELRSLYATPSRHTSN